MKSLFLSILAAVLPIVASAYDFMADGLCFNIKSDSTVQLTYYENVAQSSAPSYPELSGDVVVPEYVTHDNRSYRVTSMDYYSFMNCQNITSISLPESIVNIPYRSMNNCGKLNSVTVSSSLKTIASQAFAHCKALSSFKIPKSVNRIQESAFFFCSSLHSIEIPEGVTSIEPMTFYGCTQLKSVTLPSSLTKIGYEAFRSCTAMAEINSHIVDPGMVTVEHDAFTALPTSYPNQCKVNVPIGSSVYYNINPWKNFKIVELFLPTNDSLGDVNRDFLIDGNDINVVVNMLLGNGENDDLGVIDINGDGNFDGSDLNTLINIILGH